MTGLDWLIVAIYISSIVGIGIYFAKEAASSTADYFLAGRKLSWFMAGTSMVATTFSADTPLFVAGMSRSQGISANWFWWCLAIGQIASVFFFARLWRRTEVVTDIEFLTLRYAPSKANNALRMFKVFYDGVMINSLTLAVVLLSITKIIQALIPYQDVALLTLPGLGELSLTTALMIGLACCPLLFTILAGLHGVVTAEVIQFGMALFGAITLAVIVYMDLGAGTEGFTEVLSKSPAFREALVGFVPNLSLGDLPTFSFLILVAIGWWSFAPSNAYFVQRMLASRSERDSLLGLLWFNICHYILRPWPWIVVGLASLYYFPDLTDHESAYPLMVNKFLPVGLKGLMVASLFAAFMSTSDTHLNWGTSYLINDLYQPFLAPGRSNRHYIQASRVVMTLLSVCTILVATQLTGILKTFQFIYSILGGVSLLMILRWYWWRVNVWAEITALLVSVTMATFLEFWDVTASTEGRDLYAVRLLINTSVTSVAWILVAFLTNPRPDETTQAFYRRMKISGPGWRSVAKLTGIQALQGEFRQNLAATGITLVFLYSLLMGIGKAVFQDWPMAGLCLVLTAISGYGLRYVLRQMRF